MNKTEETKTTEVLISQPKQESFWDKKSSAWLTGCCFVPSALIALWIILTFFLGIFV